MKAITKLMFVALLIGVALSLPTKVRAGGTTYTCDWANYGRCYGPLQQWMNECSWDCTMDGGSGSYIQSCYNTCYIDENTGAKSCYQTCDQIPNQASSCVQGCINQYDAQYNSCIATYCTQE